MSFISDLMIGAKSPVTESFGTNSEFITEADMQAALEMMGDDDDFGEENSYELDEAMLYAVMDSDNNFNTIMEAMMLQEVQYFINNGREMIYEEVNVKGIFGKIKAAVKKAWEKIKQVFKKCIQWLSSKVKSDAAFIKKYGDYIKKCDKASIANFSGYDFDNINSTDLYGIVSNVTISCFEDITKKWEEAKSKSDQVKDASFDFKFDDDEIKKEKELYTRFSSKVSMNIKTPEDFINSVKKYYGILTVTDIPTFNANDIISEIRDAKMTKAAAKKAFDAAKSVIEAVLAGIESDERILLTKDKDFEGGKKLPSGASKYISVLNDISSFGIARLNNVYHYHMQAINKANTQARKLANYAVTHKLADKNKSTNESFAGFFDNPEIGLV